MPHFKSTCAHCKKPLWGIKRELTGGGGVTRSSWSHVDKADSQVNGAHAAFPLVSAIVKISRTEFAELTKASR